MMKIIHIYKLSKYKYFFRGTMFAFLAFPFLWWGFSMIIRESNSYMDMIYPFAGILICILFGFRSMFKQET